MTTTATMPPSAATSVMPAAVSVVAKAAVPAKVASSGTILSSVTNGPVANGPVANGQSSNGVMNGPVTEPKKKRKKKKKANGSTLLLGSDGTFRDQTLENEERSVIGEDQSAWRLRAICRIKRLQQVTIELEKLREELEVATDRYCDAEHAEKMVNKGLKGAHVLLEQREKSINALNLTNANLNAEIGQFTEEKKKTEKRLLLLKTVSDKLQEARDARDATEKRLEDGNAQNVLLKKSVARLEGDVAQLRAVEKELCMRNEQIFELHSMNEAREVEVRKQMRAVGGVGAGVGLVAAIVLRALTARSVSDRDD